MLTTTADPFARFNTPESPILFPVGIRNVGWQTRLGQFENAPNHRAIIRLNEAGNGANLLNIVSNTYKLVLNRELFNKIEEAMSEQMLPEHLEGVEVHDRVAGFGRICYREYIFPKIKCVIASRDGRITGKSNIAFRIIAQNGYGGSALRIHTGAIDFYCTNGMISGDYTTTYKKHTSGLTIDNLGKIIVKALMTFTNSQEVWNRWVNTPVGAVQVKHLLETLPITPKLRDNLTEQYMREESERGRNLWSVYSAMTYYASHADGEFKLRSTVEDSDNVALTMVERELNVARWVQSDAWKELENA